jgi:hypothetical protein
MIDVKSQIIPTISVLIGNLYHICFELVDACSNLLLLHGHDNRLEEEKGKPDLQDS